MLGRLRMTTQEALQAYNSIAQAIFSKKNQKLMYQDGAFKAKTLETKVKQEVAKRQLGERMLEEGSNGRLGKAFVCAIPANNMAHPRHFRTYQVRENASPDCLIWEAARATTAAPTFFKRIAIGEEGRAQEDFLDGGLRHNNPSLQVLLEARSVYGDDTQLGCLVSLGTGHQGTIGLPKPDTFQKMLPNGLIQVLKKIATNCEEIAHTFAEKFSDTPDRYFRFNLTHGAGSISLEEWDKMAVLETHTKAYLEEVDVNRSIDSVVRILCESRQPKAPQVPLRSLAKRRPASSPLFTGRTHILAALELYFQERESGQHQRREFLLCGMGGAGKTQVAMKFAEMYHDRFENIFWADASNKETLERSYKEIAIRISPSLETRCTIDMALQQLEYLNHEWLLLFDGADEIDAISDLWPPGIFGNVLYTSRNHMLRNLPLHQKSRVDELSEDEGVDLLLKASHLEEVEIHRETALDAARELGFLALAIDQAGAYIANGRCHLQDFLDQFRAHRQELLSQDAYNGASSYNRAVYATWNLSYSAIEKTASRHPGEAARSALQILNIFAFLHNENIMETIFKYAAEESNRQHILNEIVKVNITKTLTLEKSFKYLDYLLSINRDDIWDPYYFRQATELLCSYSLIQRTSSASFSMHRLVHEWVHDRLSSTGKDDFLLVSGALLALSVNWRYDTGDYLFHRDLLPHILAWRRHSSSGCGELSTYGMACYALVFSENLKWEHAAKLEEQVVKFTKKTCGVEDEATLRAMVNLACTYSKQGRLEEAEQLLSQILEVGEKTFSEDQLTKLYVKCALALTYWRQGRYKEAEKLLVPLVEEEKRLLGPEHQITLRDMGNLALIQGQLGQLDNAKKLRIHVLEVSKRMLGPEHPTTMICMINLALTYSDIGEPNKAEQLGKQALEALERVFGPGDPRTLQGVANLAHIYRDKRQLDQAIQLMATTVQGRRSAFGESHPDTMESVKWLHDWVAERNAAGTKADLTCRDEDSDNREEDAGSVGAETLEEDED
ncbi:MAG: hypothetical protein Q9214_004116 [Letrouitia sp. 1 TL-2023]